MATLLFHPLDGPPIPITPHQVSLAKQFVKKRLSGILAPGGAYLSCFTANSASDVLWRLSAQACGFVPVTINWSADSPSLMLYKMESSSSQVLVTDAGFREKHLPDLLKLASVSSLAAEDVMDYVINNELVDEDEDDYQDQTRMIIFTSGTTSKPKGCCLSSQAYKANGLALSDLTAVKDDGSPVDIVVVNPLHHANSSAMIDWGMRRRGTTVHLIERYSRSYWALLTEIGAHATGRVIAPLVSRHIDHVESMEAQGLLPKDWHHAMQAVNILLGSSPVGPDTVARVRRLWGHMPTIRFGSTETVLQVIGTSQMTAEQIALGFMQGASHRWNGQITEGYLLGRPHPNVTQARVVESIDSLKDVAEGEPGLIVSRGDNCLTKYLGADPPLSSDGWYLGFGDVGFWLRDVVDGGVNLFWMSRKAALLIRGGSNYAYAAVEASIIQQLLPAKAKVTVMGLRVSSEHEDAACVLVDGPVDAVKACLCPWGKPPEYVRLGVAPVGFKGNVLYGDLRKEWIEWLASSGVRVRH